MPTWATLPNDGGLRNAPFVRLYSGLWVRILRVDEVKHGGAVGRWNRPAPVDIWPSIKDSPVRI